MQNILNTSGELQFKLYSMEYMVKKDNDRVVIYAIRYEKDKKSFNSFEELMNNYLVYRESLIEQLDRIKITSPEFMKNWVKRFDKSK